MSAHPAKKRPRDEAARQLAGELLTLVGAVTGKENADLTAALGPGPATATLLELGVTSNSAAALRSRVFKQLEAELTTYELITTPFEELLVLIASAQKQEVGVLVPALPAGLQGSHQEPNLNRPPPR